MTMTPSGVILYGPPASGKDTITQALEQLDPRYAPYQRLKIGSGNARGYRVASPDELARLHDHGHILYRNERYGNLYVVDQPHLSAIFKSEQTPVLHLGQIAGIRAVTAYPARWITVLLWCSRETTAVRAVARGSADIDARLTAWDETAEDLKHANASDFLARLSTEKIAPEQVAKTINALVTADNITRGVQPQ